jgi:hypothetical protein
MEEKLTIEQMQQKSADARKVAKELERRLRNITEPEARKALARAINIIYARAKKWREEAKRCRKMAENIEREFNSIKANLDD